MMIQESLPAVKSDREPSKISVSMVELLTLIGLAFITGASLTISRTVPGFFSLAAYTSLLATFHALEYLITAIYQPTRISFDAFLLDHSPEYAASVMAAIVEFVTESYLFPRLKAWLLIFRYIGFAIAISGQVIRSLAMIEAKDAFSHLIAEKKAPSHSLVTTGIYRIMRHPSYTGFFLWCLGTQIILGNPVCIASFYNILTQFFQERIKYEEETLIKFFSSQYVKYKQNTWSGFLGVK